MSERGRGGRREGKRVEGRGGGGGGGGEGWAAQARVKARGLTQNLSPSLPSMKLNTHKKNMSK